MGSMEFYRAESIAQAVEYLKKYADRAVVLAGGTDILVQLNQHNFPEDTVFVGIEDVEECKGIYLKGHEIHIGSLVTDAQLAASPIIQKYANALYLAAKESASPQVRNRATVGGNVVTASPSGDVAAALTAFEADAVIWGTTGRRVVKVEDIPVFVKKTCLEKTDVIQKFILKIADKKEGSDFRKIGKRKAMTISIVNTATKIRLTEDGSRIAEAVVAVGACAPTIVRLKALERALEGQTVTDTHIEDLAQKACEDVSPITDIRASAWYRKELVQVLAVRAVRAAILDALKEA